MILSNTLLQMWLFIPAGLGRHIPRDIHAMAAIAVAPCVAISLACMVLTMQDRRFSPAYIITN